MREIKALISVGVAAVSYVMLPDILDRQETICFLAIVSISLYVIMAVIENEIRELHEKRESLRIRKPGKQGSMSKFNLPKKIIKFPVEERYETRRNA